MKCYLTPRSYKEIKTNELNVYLQTKLSKRHASCAGLYQVLYHCKYFLVEVFIARIKYTHWTLLRII